MLVEIFFFFNDTATTEIYTLSLHDALPILLRGRLFTADDGMPGRERVTVVDEALAGHFWPKQDRSEEHTSELQSRQYLVCRLLLEKKKHTSPVSFDQIVLVCHNAVCPILHQ